MRVFSTALTEDAIVALRGPPPPDVGPLELRSVEHGVLRVIRPPVVFPGLAIDGNDLEVKFDGDSHQSGKRAYVRCLKHKAEGCVKYTILQIFPSTAECCIGWLPGIAITVPI